MSEQTKIQWATHTFNPWEGCTKVSPGCAHCYAEARNHRFGNDNWGKGKPRRRTSPATWRNPVKWNRQAGDTIASIRGDIGNFSEYYNTSDYERPRVFPSLCDWLDEEVPVEWLADFLKLIQDTPHLDWLLLTKRPEKFNQRLLSVEAHYARLVQGENDANRFNFVDDWLKGNAPANVWPGVSVEDQDRADERIPALRNIPAEVLFLSVEPMIGMVNLHEVAPDWVIVGGESGPKARPCNVNWIRSVVEQCHQAGVPCFVKQLGRNVFYVDEYNQFEYRLFLKDPKGGDPEEWPADLRVREFPR